MCVCCLVIHDTHRKQSALLWGLIYPVDCVNSLRGPPFSSRKKYRNNKARRIYISFFLFLLQVGRFRFHITWHDHVRTKGTRSFYFVSATIRTSRYKYRVLYTAFLLLIESFLMATRNFCGLPPQKKMILRL